MKYSKIALACGLALSAMAAQAAGPTIPAGTVTIYLSGASAPDSFINDTVKDMLTNEIAMRTTSANDFRAFFGQATNAVPGVAAGTNILLIKRSEGGSVFGVDPVARAQRIKTIDVSNCNSNSATPSDPYIWVCGTKGIDPGLTDANTASNTGLVPDFGVSDVEPALFKASMNVENNQAELSKVELAKLTSTPVNQLMMGIVATNAVTPGTHISRTQYGAMLAGLIDTWDTIDNTTNSDPVIVCRRPNGSGTQASYNWFFSGFPCNKSSSGFVGNQPKVASDSYGYNAGGILAAGIPLSGTTAASGVAGSATNPFYIDPSQGLTIVENSTSGGVRNCLRAANSRTVHNVVGASGVNYRVDFTKLASAGKAIGVLSLDSYGTGSIDPAVTTRREIGWNFRMLDGAGTYDALTQTASASATGIAPSKANLVDGKYDFVVELAMQKRNASVTNAQGDVVATPSAIKTAFYNKLVSNLGSTKYTGNENAVVTSTPNAFATLPSVDAYDTKSALVSKYQRSVNTCSPLVRFPGSPF